MFRSVGIKPDKTEGKGGITCDDSSPRDPFDLRVQDSPEYPTVLARMMRGFHKSPIETHHSIRAPLSPPQRFIEGDGLGHVSDL
jgi:hypothetical protein